MGKFFYLENYGCTANSADGEKMAILLQNDGWIETSEDDANILIINTCGVKNYTESKIIRRISELSTQNKHPLIITGCLPRICEDKLLAAAPNLGALVDTRSIHLIVQIANEVKNGKTNLKYFNVCQEAIHKSEIFNINPNVVTGSIIIAEGCTGACSFCATKFARGKIVSFPIDQLKAHAEFLVAHGKKELWLTAQDTSAYNYFGNNLVNLVKSLLQIESKFRLRIGMANPEALALIAPELLELMLEDSRIFKFLHIPLQAANNTVLANMKRRYTIEDYQQLILTLRAKIPDIGLATDIICGFPEESEEQFQQTLDFLQWMKPNVINVSRFSLRPQIAAAHFNQLHGRITKQRSRRAMKLVENIMLSQKQQCINKRLEVLIDEQGKNNTFIARTNNYEPIVLTEGTLGSEVLVRIQDATPWYLKGSIITK